MENCQDENDGSSKIRCKSSDAVASTIYRLLVRRRKEQKPNSIQT